MRDGDVCADELMSGRRGDASSVPAGGRTAASTCRTADASSMSSLARSSWNDSLLLLAPRATLWRRRALKDMAPQPRDWSYNFCRGERQVFSVIFCLATRGEAEYFLAAVASASERFPCHARRNGQTCKEFAKVCVAPPRRWCPPILPKKLTFSHILDQQRASTAPFRECVASPYTELAGAVHPSLSR